jgi:hypothetical protein
MFSGFCKLATLAQTSTGGFGYVQGDNYKFSVDLAEANGVKTYNKLTTNLVINIVKINRLKQGKNDTKAIQKML